MQLPDASIGSIVAAIIGGTVVFVTTVVTKEQKTSEFRQVWIDALREDISEFVAGTAEVTAVHHYKSLDKEKDEFLYENLELLHRLSSLEHRIVLRLNPKKHAGLISKISTYRRAMIATYGQSGGYDRFQEEALTSGLLADSKDVLKVEWERVKKGEPIFRATKWLAIAVAVVLGAFLLVAYFHYHSESSALESASAGSSKGLNQQVLPQNNQSIQVIVDTRQTPTAGASHPTASAHAIARKIEPRRKESLHISDCLTQDTQVPSENLCPTQ